MLTDIINSVFKLKDDFLKFVKVETDYVKLTVAEKAVKIATIIILGMLCVVSMWFVALMMSFALANFLCLYLPAWAAYLCTAGAFLAVMFLLFLLRRPLLMNPLSRAITLALFRKDSTAGDDDETD